MMVRVQKSKEVGLDFSLALSFYLLFLWKEKISESEAQEISGPLSLSRGQFLLVGGERLGSLLISRGKKKERKKKFVLRARCGRRRLHLISPFSFIKKKESTRALSKEQYNTKMAFVAGGISTLRISAANHVRPKGAKESRKNRPVKHRPSDKNRAPTNYPTVDPASIPPVYTVVSEAKKA